MTVLKFAGLPDVPRLLCPASPPLDPSDVISAEKVDELVEQYTQADKRRRLTGSLVERARDVLPPMISVRFKGPWKESPWGGTKAREAAAERANGVKVLAEEIPRDMKELMARKRMRLHGSKAEDKKKQRLSSVVAVEGPPPGSSVGEGVKQSTLTMAMTSGKASSVAPAKKPSPLPKHPPPPLPTTSTPAAKRPVTDPTPSEGRKSPSRQSSVSDDKNSKDSSTRGVSNSLGEDEEILFEAGFSSQFELAGPTQGCRSSPIKHSSLDPRIVRTTVSNPQLPHFSGSSILPVSSLPHSASVPHTVGLPPFAEPEPPPASSSQPPTADGSSPPPPALPQTVAIQEIYDPAGSSLRRLSSFPSQALDQDLDLFDDIDDNVEEDGKSGESPAKRRRTDSVTESMMGHEMDDISRFVQEDMLA